MTRNSSLSQNQVLCYPADSIHVYVKDVFKVPISERAYTGKTPHNYPMLLGYSLFTYTTTDTKDQSTESTPSAAVNLNVAHYLVKLEDNTQ